LNRSRWPIVAGIVVLALAGVWVWKARTGSAAPKYRTADVDRGAIESVVSATGTIRPVVQVEVGTQVSGTVSKLFADYNSRVRQGQVIAQLEPSSFRARWVQAEAAVARADASVKDGERALARAQELFNKNYLSQADLDNASVTLQLRKADLQQARAALESARVDLEHTTIRAPIDGVVIARTVDLGQTVAASLQAPQLFVIANDLAHMQVETRIDEADIGQIRPGLPVTFTVDAFPDQGFSGQVAQVRLEPITDQGVVTYTTVIRTENPDLRLRPGMTANVTVKLERRDDALRVPNAALRFRPPAPQGARGGMAASAGGGRGEGGAQAAVREGSTGGAPAESSGAGGRPRGGQGGGFSDAQRASWRERMGKMTPGQRQHFRDSMMTARGSGGGAGTGGGGAIGGPGGRGLRTSSEGGDLGPSFAGPGLRPGAVYVLGNGKPARVRVLTGITDGAFTEVQSDQLKVGDKVIIGMESMARGTNLQPPPGMGGPGFRGGGGRGR
jgi:HlyD family secretion protein